MTPPARLPDFALDDQFGRELDSSTYDGVPLIVVVGNREGASGVALWTAALRAVIEGRGDTHVLPVAEVNGVPRLLRRMVSRLLPRDPEQWCALDWDGQLGAPIRGTASPLVAAAYGADRALRAWTALPVDTVESALLVKLVEGAE
ncbi:hypothetical protein BH11GEM1_BH11GEM1_26500 [soil metagenome]